MKISICQQKLGKILHTEFHKNPSVRSHSDTRGGRTDRHDEGGRRFSRRFSHISSYSCELYSIFHCSSFMHHKTLHDKRGKVKVQQQAILVSRSVRLILSVYFHQFYFCFATSQDHDKDPTMVQTTSLSGTTA